ncbi:capsid protein, partial [Lactobacillus mulieris]|nr:capsid protein [Lactobacillus mulieris]
ETQLNVLQGQMADLLGAISISGDTLQINGKLAVRGNVTTYWDGADQFIVYSGHNFKRGYFGMYDNGQFKVNG